MTLGLAACSDDCIALAIESEGLPAPGAFPSTLVLVSKLLCLQANPEVVVLAAGGLEHWAEVAKHYKRQPSVGVAANHIRQILDSCMTVKNKAFGLVCGFEGQNPVCVRINRFVGNSFATANPENFQQVRSLGDVQHSGIAQEHACVLIASGKQPLVAIVEAIVARLPGERIRPPIHTWLIRRGD